MIELAALACPTFLLIFSIAGRGGDTRASISRPRLRKKGDPPAETTKKKRRFFFLLRLGADSARLLSTSSPTLSTLPLRGLLARGPPPSPFSHTPSPLIKNPRKPKQKTKKQKKQNHGGPARRARAHRDDAPQSERTPQARRPRRDLGQGRGPRREARRAAPGPGLQGDGREAVRAAGGEVCGARRRVLPRAPVEAAARRRRRDGVCGICGPPRRAATGEARREG